MRLPNPPKEYDPAIERERNRQLEIADGLSMKKLEDIETYRFTDANGIDRQARIILRSPDGTRWYLTVDNAGVVGATSL